MNIFRILKSAFSGIKTFQFILVLNVILLFVSCENREVIEKRNENGLLIERYTINKSTKLKEGFHEIFSANSNALVQTSNYKAGVLDGDQIVYYETGQIEEKRHLDETGSLSGDFLSYFENGKMKSEGHYAYGAMNGKWKFFYSNGNVKQILYYRDNVENGPFVEFHETGKMAAEGTYENDLEHGLLKIYDKDGTLTEQRDCNNGVCRTIWRSDVSKDGSKKL